MKRLLNRKNYISNTNPTPKESGSSKREPTASKGGTKSAKQHDNGRLNSFREESWESRIEAPTEEYWEWCCCACGKYQRTFILGENYKQEICKGVKGYACKHKRCEDCSEVRSTGVEETQAKEKAWAASKEGKYYDKWCPE